MTTFGLPPSTLAIEARSRSRPVRRGPGVFLAWALVMALATAGQAARYGKAPEFPSQDPKQWIGPPQNWKGLEGKVVILDVWTFG